MPSISALRRFPNLRETALGALLRLLAIVHLAKTLLYFSTMHYRAMRTALQEESCWFTKYLHSYAMFFITFVKTISHF
jgi:hypothetical protein